VRKWSKNWLSTLVTARAQNLSLRVMANAQVTLMSKDLAKKRLKQMELKVSNGAIMICIMTTAPDGGNAMPPHHGIMLNTTIPAII